MITSLNQVPVGILGLGFLGKILSSELASFEESWGTWHKTPPPEKKFPVFHFDWADENCWDSLPEASATVRPGAADLPPDGSVSLQAAALPPGLLGTSLTASPRDQR